MNGSHKTGKLLLAWAVCLAICGGVEAALHIAPASWAMAYDQRSLEMTLSADYINIRRTVACTPPPQVCVIGSSRARAIVSAPIIRRFLLSRGFGEVDVRVYAAPNLNAATCLALVRLMRNRGHVPAIFVYAIEPRQLADCVGQGNYAPWLCDARSALRHDRPLLTADYKTFKTLISTWADLWVRSLWLRELVRLQPATTGQSLGGYSGDQIGHMLEKEENTLTSHPILDSDLVTSLLLYDCESRHTPSVRQKHYTEKTLDFMRKIARPVVVELPLPDATINDFPRHYYGKVMDFYARACRMRDIPFFRAVDVGFVAEDRCFSNGTHANWTGALIYSHVLAEKVIMPMLQEKRAKPTVGPTPLASTRPVESQ